MSELTDSDDQPQVPIAVAEDIDARISELSAFVDGWYDGIGRTATADQWAIARRIAFVLAGARKDARPAIFLTPDGTPLLELLWQEVWDVSFDVEAGGTIWGHAWNKRTDEVREWFGATDDAAELERHSLQWLVSLGA
jgi:hypothetical protein